jgi:hypothetical protein
MRVAGGRRRVVEGGLKFYCIPINYAYSMPRTPTVERELYVDADCADHVDGAEAATVRTDCGEVVWCVNTYPNATEAGTPMSGRLANDRSVEV